MLLVLNEFVKYLARRTKRIENLSEKNIEIFRLVPYNDEEASEWGNFRNQSNQGEHLIDQEAPCPLR